MKRDIDLVRKILFAVEECDRDPLEWVPLSFGGHDEKTIAYHVWLLIDAGLIEGTNCSSLNGFCWQAKRLTWAGHEFLQSIRDDTIWNKAKEKVLKPTASWTFGILIEWLKQEIKEKIGIP